VKDLRLFESIEKTQRITVEVADGTLTSTDWKGTVRVRLTDGITVVLSDVYYVPKLNMNLIDCSGERSIGPYWCSKAWREG